MSAMLLRWVTVGRALADERGVQGRAEFGQEAAFLDAGPDPQAQQGVGGFGESAAGGEGPEGLLLGGAVAGRGALEGGAADAVAAVGAPQ
ncbi:hypothetical protein [Streptomyces sp. NPDC059611]|uniref:hypothetical protein n=1 Tax=Streptomyces sp. NPDC059611 TaxID=3346884 RepID=UPI00368E081A